MKNILITGGPTNEYIDEVMKITNMSTGSLSTNLGMRFLQAGYSVTLVLNRSVNTEKLLNMEQSSNLEIIPVETTADMLEAIEHLVERSYGVEVPGVALYAQHVIDPAEGKYLLAALALELVALLLDA